MDNKTIIEDDDDNTIEYEQQVQISLALFMNSYDAYMKIELNNPTKEEVNDECTIRTNRFNNRRCK